LTEPISSAFIAAGTPAVERARTRVPGAGLEKGEVMDGRLKLLGLTLAAVFVLSAVGAPAAFA
jgi:hypothetical protein